MKLIKRNIALALIAGAALSFGIFAGCDNGSSGDEDNGGGNSSASISWSNESSGTLTVLNNTNKDMILFQGQTPSVSNILGGVRATSSRTFDISDDVDDFDVGGYMILRGISKDEYEKNQQDLSAAKIEYSAMATYGNGKKFRAEISPSYSGDYYYKLTNKGRIGMELRKDSPDGEKIGYLPALATNYAIYSNSSDDLTIYPVYVYYSKTTQTVTTVKSTKLVETVSIGPRPVTDSSVQTRILPNDPSVTWDQIAKAITYPVAFVTVTNNVPNQSSRVQIASGYLKSQNGYDSLNSGEMATYEVASTNEGQNKNLVLTLYGGTVQIPVKQDGNSPVIKNGYDYTVILEYTGNGALDEPASYTASIVEGAKRDIENEIESL